jgi:hypothetical protein
MHSYFLHIRIDVNLPWLLPIVGKMLHYFLASVLSMNHDAPHFFPYSRSVIDVTVIRLQQWNSIRGLHVHGTHTPKRPPYARPYQRPVSWAGTT